MLPIKSKGCVLRFGVERIYSLRIYTAILHVAGSRTFMRLYSWHELDKRKLKRMVRKEFKQYI